MESGKEGVVTSDLWPLIHTHITDITRKSSSLTTTTTTLPLALSNTTNWLIQFLSLDHVMSMAILWHLTCEGCNASHGMNQSRKDEQSIKFGLWFVNKIKVLQVGEFGFEKFVGLMAFNVPTRCYTTSCLNSDHKITQSDSKWIFRTSSTSVRDSSLKEIAPLVQLLW